MWLLDSNRPNFYNLSKYYKIELEKKESNANLRFHLLVFPSDISTRTFRIEDKNQYNVFKEKLNNFLKISGFLFIETNSMSYIWLNTDYIVSIVSNLKGISSDTKSGEVLLEIETTMNYIDSIPIGNRLQLQLFVAKNMSNIITIPNLIIKKDSRGAKAKYDITNISL